MALHGVANCMKYILFIFNLLFFLSGGTMLAAGAYLFTREGPFVTLLPSFPFLNAATVTMVVGGIIMLVSFLGCCGAIRENSRMVFTYFILMVGILIVEMIAGGLGISTRNQVSAFVERDLTQQFLPLYSTVGQQGLTTAWDRMQNFLLCCGVTNVTDWSQFHPQMYGVGQTPDSCCVTHIMGCGMDPIATKWERGCKDALIMELQRHIGAVGGIGIGVGVFQGCVNVLVADLEAYIYYIAAGGIAIGVFQILGMVFSMVLYTSIKRGGTYA